MSYSLDANLLLFASDKSFVWHDRARSFLQERVEDADILCLTWPALLAYQRIATHPSIFSRPLSFTQGWDNVQQLIRLPHERVIREADRFAQDYERVVGTVCANGNLVPDVRIATILLQNGVRRMYSSDPDFREFEFLDVVNPLK